MTKHRNISTGFSSVSRGPSLTADQNGVAASQSLYEQGTRLWNRLLRSQSRSGLVSVLRPPLYLPMCGHTWRSAMEVGFDKLIQPWVLLKSGMPRHEAEPMLILLPGVWQGQADIQGYEDFRRLKGRDFVEQLAKELDDEYLTRIMRDEEHVFAALASRWMGLMPPISFSYLGFGRDMGSARSIDLDSMVIGKNVRAKKPQAELDQLDEAMTKLLSAIRDHRGRKKMFLEKRMREVEQTAGFKKADPRWLCFKSLLLSRTLKKVAKEWPKRNRKSRTRQPSGLVRMAGEVSNVSKLIAATKRDPDGKAIAVSKVQRTVITHFIEVMNDLEFSREEVARFKVASMVPRRKMDLRRPAAYQAYYGLDREPVDPNDNLPMAARRILADTLHFGGRRAACCALMTIGDIKIGGVSESLDNSVIFGRFTKTRTAWNSWHAISFLWPDCELDFTRKFLLACERAGLPDSLQIMQVAELGFRSDNDANGPYTKITADLAQLRLRDGLLPGHRLATHLGRFAFASYWMLRVLALQFPFLLTTALYLKLRDHFWFKDEGLLKLDRLLKGIPYHHLHVASSMMGLSGPEQFISTYNRGQALELLVLQEILMSKIAN
jgi:hypothetical protein